VARKDGVASQRDIEFVRQFMIISMTIIVSIIDSIIVSIVVFRTVFIIVSLILFTLDPQQQAFPLHQLAKLFSAPKRNIA